MAFPFGNTSSAQFGGTPNEPPNNSVVGPDLEEIQTEVGDRVHPENEWI